MRLTNHLAVIIPVYNEEGVVRTVIEKWSEALCKLDINFEMHVYNDGSTDNSAGEIQGAARNLKNVFFHTKKNSGHGPTILRGYREHSSSEWIFQVDSDNEMGPESFRKLWVEKDKFDFLCGKRAGRGQTLSRKLLSLVSRLLVSLLYGKGIFDVNVPYRLYRTTLFREYFFKIPRDTFAPNVILSGIASSKGFRVFETPVPFTTRATGEVSIKKFTLLKSAARSFFQTVVFRFTL